MQVEAVESRDVQFLVHTGKLDQATLNQTKHYLVQLSIRILRNRKNWSILVQSQFRLKWTDFVPFLLHFDQDLPFNSYRSNSI